MYLLKKNNVKTKTFGQARRKYQINENFFDRIDTPEKAYFLGILYADGCNSPDSKCVKIELTEGDKTILEKLSSLIYKDHKPLRLRIRTSEFFDGKEYPARNAYQLAISSKHISEKLISHGLVKAKSLILTFPTWLDKDLESHFIRGYFDGDGSLSFGKSLQTQISILGTRNFCSGIKSITDKIGVKSSLCHAKKGSETMQFIVHGNKSAITFLHWIYTSSSLHLDRKYEKYKSILKNLSEKKNLIKQKIS